LGVDAGQKKYWINPVGLDEEKIRKQVKWQTVKDKFIAQQNFWS